MRVRIAVREQPPVRHISCGMFELAPGDWMVTRIADVGPQFPPGSSAQHFGPPCATKGARETRFGLAAVLALARDAGGAVRAFNAPERGAVIEAWFPAVDRAADTGPVPVAE